MKRPCLLLKKTLFIFIIICFNFSLNGQRIKKDTLAKYSFVELHDKSYAAKPDSLKALLYANYHLKKALADKDTLNIASSYYILSSINKDTLSFVNYWNTILSNKKTRPKLQVIGNLELGDFYFHKGKKDISLKKYLSAHFIARNNNKDSLKYISIYKLGSMNSRVKKYSEAIKLYKQVYNFYLSKNKKGKISDNYYNVLMNLSINFLYNKQYDSALFYNQKLQSIALKDGDSTFYKYSINVSGKISHKQKKYSEAILLLKKSIPNLIKDENYLAISSTYNLLAESYMRLTKLKFAKKYYIKIDSLKDVTNIIHTSQVPAYKFLISHYKKEKNDKKQLEYINKYIKIDSVLNARSISIAKNLKDNYDIPNLIAERKRIENRLQNRLSTSNKWILGISAFTFIIAVFLIFQTKKRKLYKKRFLALLEENTSITHQQKKVQKNGGSSVPKEIIKQLLTHLDEFENQQKYLKHEVTLLSLAKTFQTNSNYLSKVINQYKEQSFNNYINSLRINYTVEKLKKDSRFRKYSIKAIAEEVGFNTSESFSKAFYKNTGIHPSYFIKEIEKSNK